MGLDSGGEFSALVDTGPGPSGDKTLIRALDDAPAGHRGSGGLEQHQVGAFAGGSRRADDAGVSEELKIRRGQEHGSGTAKED